MKAITVQIKTLFPIYDAVHPMELINFIAKVDSATYAEIRNYAKTITKSFYELIYTIQALIYLRYY